VDRKNLKKKMTRKMLANVKFEKIEVNSEERWKKNGI